MGVACIEVGAGRKRLLTVQDDASSTRRVPRSTVKDAATDPSCVTRGRPQFDRLAASRTIYDGNLLPDRVHDLRAASFQQLGNVFERNRGARRLDDGCRLPDLFDGGVVRQVQPTEVLLESTEVLHDGLAVIVR